MRVSITPEQEQFINAQVSSGAYPSAEDVVRDALQLFAGYETMRRSRIKTLNEDIQLGLDQAASETPITPEALKEHMKTVKKQFFSRDENL